MSQTIHIATLRGHLGTLMITIIDSIQFPFAMLSVSSIVCFDNMSSKRSRSLRVKDVLINYVSVCRHYTPDCINIIYCTNLIDEVNFWRINVLKIKNVPVLAVTEGMFATKENFGVYCLNVKDNLGTKTKSFTPINCRKQMRSMQS